MKKIIIMNNNSNLKSFWILLCSFILILLAIITCFFCYKINTKIDTPSTLSISPPLLDGFDIESAEVVNGMESPPLTLALISKDGYELYFQEVNPVHGDEGILILGRILDTFEPFNSLPYQLNGKCPFSIFDALAPSNAKVPLRLISYTDPGVLLASGRQIDSTDSFYSNIRGMNRELADERRRKPSMPASRPKPIPCYQLGGGGYYIDEDRFRLDYCWSGGQSVNRYWFCDEGLWTSNIRNSVFGTTWTRPDAWLTRINVICGIATFDSYYFADNKKHLFYRHEFSKGIWWVRYCNKGDNRPRQNKITVEDGALRVFNVFLDWGDGRCW